MAGEEGMPSGGYVTRITNDDREVEMDDNLQLVGSYLGNLKNMALDMGDTIENQNKQIDRIGDKSEVGIKRVEAANKRTQDLIRRAWYSSWKFSFFVLFNIFFYLNNIACMSVFMFSFNNMKLKTSNYSFERNWDLELWKNTNAYWHKNWRSIDGLSSGI